MREQIHRMLRSGLRPIDIARQLSLPRYVVQTIAKSSGITYPGKRLTDDVKSKIDQLHQLHGYGAQRIAQELGVPRSSVRDYLRLPTPKVERLVDQGSQPDEVGETPIPIGTELREKIHRMLESGLRPIEIARQLSLPYIRIHSIARERGMRFTGKHLTDEEKQEVQRLRELHGYTVRLTAQELGLSKTAVGRASRAQFLKVQDQGGTEVKPEVVKETKRCPIHGRVTLWPCVACAAIRGPI